MDKYVDMDLIDAVLEKPIGFSIGRRHLNLYQPSLGAKLLISRALEALQVDNSIFQTNPFTEALRLCSTKKEEVANLIALKTLRSKDDFFNPVLIKSRAGLISKELDTEDLARLFCVAITDNDVERFLEHIGLNDDKEKRMKVIKSKSRKNTMIFGGKSIYGVLIDEACQKFGWTLDYVVWGISYTNLKMMLADVISDVYLTDEELKNLNKGDSSGAISADDMTNMNMILQMNWD